MMYILLLEYNDVLMLSASFFFCLSGMDCCCIMLVVHLNLVRMNLKALEKYIY